MKYTSILHWAIILFFIFSDYCSARNQHILWFWYFSFVDINKRNYQTIIDYLLTLVPSWHHTTILNIHIVYILYTELHNDISTVTRIWVHTHTQISKQFQTDHLCERDVSAFVWGCSLANLLLFVSFLLFKQPLSNWAPFSSTCLPALLALLNKPFTPLFIPFASAGCRCQQQTAVEPL